MALEEKELAVNNIELKWNEQIVEFDSKTEASEDFKIKGIAINETTTSNGHKFLSEELSKSAGSLMGVPLLKDHENRIENIVGRVTNAYFDSMQNNIQFEAKIMDVKVREMIKDGRINSVSVGASVSELEETEEGEIIPRGIQFKELSLVAVPADQGATFNVALMEAYNKDNPKVKAEELRKNKGLTKAQSFSSNEKLKQMKGGKLQMTEDTPEEKEQPEEKVEAPAETAEETKEESKEEPKEEPAVTEENVKNWVKEAIKESDADEAPKEAPAESKEEVKDEVKDEEDEDEEEVEEGLKFVQESGSLRGGAITVVRKLR